MIEDFIKSFTELGIEFKELDLMDEWGECPTTIHIKYGEPRLIVDQVLRIESGIGYSGFYCDFHFFEGKYLGHGVWE